MEEGRSGGGLEERRRREKWGRDGGGSGGRGVQEGSRHQTLPYSPSLRYLLSTEECHKVM